MRSSIASKLGPVFVAIAAILWGLDSFFRIELLRTFSPTVITLSLHILMLLPFLPTLATSATQVCALRTTTWGLLSFSGAVSSGLGKMLFSLALIRGSPTCACASASTAFVVAQIKFPSRASYSGD